MRQRSFVIARTASMRPPPKEAEYRVDLHPIHAPGRASMRPPPKEAEYVHGRIAVRQGPAVASMRPPPKEAEYGPGGRREPARVLWLQ